MDQYIVQVDGVPFYLIINGNGYYTYAVGQNVNIDGSPLVVSFEPPIAPTVSAGDIYMAIKNKL